MCTVHTLGSSHPPCTLVTWSVAAVLLLGGGSPAWAQEYEIEPLDPTRYVLRITRSGHHLGYASANPDGSSQFPAVWKGNEIKPIGPAHLWELIFPVSISENGDVCGSYTAGGGGLLHAFRWRWQSGLFEDIAPQSGTNSFSIASGINLQGHIVGRAEFFPPIDAFGTVRPAIWHGSVPTVLPVTPETPTIDFSANDINAAGDIVGTGWANQNHRVEALVWRNGNFYTLRNVPVSPPPNPIPAGTIVSTEAHYISDTEATCGRADIWRTDGAGADYHAVMWDFVGADMRVIGGPSTRATAINARGEVVGTDDSIGRAMLWRNGQALRLDDLTLRPPGYNILSAFDITDDGRILAYAERFLDGEYVFAGQVLLTPKDADGDGLLDVWETAGGGIDGDGDGGIDLDLYARGARPNRKDLFIEVDAMVGRMPSAETFNLVVAAFASAPFLNGDGSQGIALHIQADRSDIPLAAWPTNWWAAFDAVKATNFGTDAERAAPNAAAVLAAKRLAYRYCIFADSYDVLRDAQGQPVTPQQPGDSTGYAELPGNDFMVTLGQFHISPTQPAPGGTQEAQAGTFMHELGHTLGLQHGGADSINYKPNYYSVMNYTWQVPTPGYGPWALDYSRQQLPALNEYALSEAAGLGAAPGSYVGVTVVYGASTQPSGAALHDYASLRGGDPVDWNGSGAIENNSVALNVNYIGYEPSPMGETLYGYHDWRNLLFSLRGGGNYMDGARARDTADGELTVGQYLAMQSAPRWTSGDLNCDDVVDFFDIDPFLVALFDAGEFAVAFPGCRRSNGDCNGDGIVDFFDIDAFLECLFSECP